MSDTNNSGGIGICGATFITFLVLKLTHTIDWSWWWVTAPLWIPTALVLGLLVIGAVLIGLGKGLNNALDGRADKKAKAARDQRKADWRSKNL